jgi:2-succinyl-6-hydroxy-2,4-cyclohexadiene-1-carboxylate synthase
VTAVVFVPGFMQRGAAWAPVAERLPERYRGVVLDHRAHDRDGRLAEIAEAGKGGVLVGYSLGGRLSLHTAVAEPARYRGLVTIGSAAGIAALGERAERREADERLAAWMETMPIEEIVAVWERQPLFADQSETLVEAQHADRLSHEGRQLALLLRTAGQGAMEPVWDELPRLRLPLLALAGSRDDRYAAAARRMARLAPRGRPAIVEEAGHAAHLQQPETVADLLVGFLDELQA